MDIWNALLLVYRTIDVRIPGDWLLRKRFVHRLADGELEDALDSFRAFPPLVAELSKGEAAVTHEIIHVEEPLSSLSAEQGGSYWPSPVDVRTELDVHAPPGRYDSVFVLWPQNNVASGAKVPCRGWGLATAPAEWSNGATYAAVANVPSWMWRIPMMGEVWLHEWLHGVCGSFAKRGFPMPAGDADAGGSHGYIQSPTTGWTDFYRDLMTGQVIENGKATGITAEAWRGRDIHRAG